MSDDPQWHADARYVLAEINRAHERAEQVEARLRHIETMLAVLTEARTAERLSERVGRLEANQLIQHTKMGMITAAVYAALTLAKFVFDALKAD